MNAQRKFFAKQAKGFSQHIDASIPGYSDLQDFCVRWSQRFIQDGTAVLDAGCSTGELMARVEKHNRPYHCDVRYLGLDVQPKFGQHWARLGNPGLNFEVCDLRKCEHFTDASLVFSLFTLQFIPEKDKLALLRKYRSGLVQGGALIIAEKVLADSGRMQDALTFPFYDHKMKSFRPKHILKKEKDLRGQMVCWYEQELVENLRAAGFRDIQQVWSNFPFVAKLALV